MNHYVILVLGIAAAGVGGEMFVRGSIGMAKWFRISPGIVGATVAAFATSSPELSISVNSALAGTPQISLGDVLGSNIVNVALILGLAISISGIQCDSGMVKRNFNLAIIIPILTGIFIIDGVISRLDGVLLLGLFTFWLVRTVIDATSQRKESKEEPGMQRKPIAFVVGGLGLAILFAAGNLIVTGAKGIAASFGLEPFIIGATVVAVGTSVPELATTVMAKLRGHDEIGLGTILGSNIFNGLLVVSVAAVLCPITIRPSDVVVSLVFGAITLLIAFPKRDGSVGRSRGLFLLILYAAYVFVTILFFKHR